MTSIFEGHLPQNKAELQIKTAKAHKIWGTQVRPTLQEMDTYPTFFFGKENHPLPKPP